MAFETSAKDHPSISSGVAPRAVNMLLICSRCSVAWLMACSMITHGSTREPSRVSDAGPGKPVGFSAGDFQKALTAEHEGFAHLFQRRRLLPGERRLDARDVPEVVLLGSNEMREGLAYGALGGGLRLGIQLLARELRAGIHCQ